MNKVVIVGGVAGGATAAARLRRLDESIDILLIERGRHISYANCGLPYYLGGTIAERDRLLLQSPEEFTRRLNVQVWVGTEVTRIDRYRKAVEVKRLDSGETGWEDYDRLLLSPGAVPIRLSVPGVNLDGIYTLRSVADADAIKTAIDAGHVHRAVVVGGGFIGLEMTENLRQRGLAVTVVEMADQVMTGLDYELAAEVQAHLEDRGVELYLERRVTAFHQRDGRLAVELDDSRLLPADLVIMAAGVRPDSRLAREAGLEVAPEGGIVVNDFLQTSDPDIYAVGDAIVFPDPVTGRPDHVWLAGPANRQARIAADNMVQGHARRYRGAIGTAIAKVFDLTVASTGMSEKDLRREGIPHLTSITRNASHAGYYPGARGITVKIQFTAGDGRLLGAQIVGREGVDKRIDLLATVLGRRGSVLDLQDLEHAYAPPYSSAKDPVHIAAYTAENILRGLVSIVSWRDVATADPAGQVLLDVRTPAEFRRGTIPGAINIPEDDLRQQLDRLPRGRRIVVFCAVGQRGYYACRLLMQKGFREVVNLSGGYRTWRYATRRPGGERPTGEIIGSDDVIYEGRPGD